MDSQSIINLALAGGGALMGFILHGFRDSLKSLKQTDENLLEKLQKIEVLVAGKYVTNDQLDKKMDAIFSALRRIEDKQVHAPCNNPQSSDDGVIKWKG